MKKIAVKPIKNHNKSPSQTLESTIGSLKDASIPGIKTPIKGDNVSDPRLIPFKRELKVPNPSFQSSATSISWAKPIGFTTLENINGSGIVTNTSVTNNQSKNGNNIMVTPKEADPSTRLLRYKSQNWLENERCSSKIECDFYPSFWVTSRWLYRFNSWVKWTLHNYLTKSETNILYNLREDG